MAKMDEAIRDQLAKQPILHIPENTDTLLVEDTRNEYAYYREQMQPDRAEIEQVRAEVYRTEMELARQRNKLEWTIDELHCVTNSLRQAETELLDNWELISQLVGYLNSIEWGTHEERTRSQSLRERAHKYLTTRNTIAT